MPQKIDLSIKARVEGGPFVNIASSLDVESYSVTKLNLEDDAEDKELVIQPDADVEQVKILIVDASAYSTDLTYKINNDGANGTALDQPNVFAGTGAVARASDGDAPTKLFLTNKTGDDVEVQVLVGRDATP